ncbi:HAMP domain-containing sensor histidine kinase [Neptuniibacter marinus]|uniref:HAMP domain-containing sensor histidine kinase n=1 Tax=Neptuniibacter marinus TaxID=1806670 RepID=UPI00082C0078|nr:sensor histidine kinase [Neptuniibacter marinus]
MKAVLRLNLVVALVFLFALLVTVYGMLQQATKDITREVSAGVSFTHQLLSAAVTDEELLKNLLDGETRHVHLSIVDNTQLSSNDQPPHHSDEVPEWFFNMIPGLDHIEEKQYFRYLSDGRALRLQADTSDEVEEVWESVQSVLVLFTLSALLSNLAIYIGVRHGVKPVTDFLNALKDIEKGRFTARLDHYSIREINDLSEHFNAMALALENAEQDNARLTHELMRLQEKERAHLARELHDDLGQYLTGIRAQAYLIKASANNPDMVSAVGEQITVNCDAMHVSFRQLIRKLHPVILEQLGLLDAIRTLVETWSQSHHIKVDLHFPESLISLSDENNTHIYRIIQEALNNIARHAQASLVDLTLKEESDSLKLIVSDNGIGADCSKGSGLGLRSMQERARCMQGTLNFKQLAEGGSMVSMEIPVIEVEEV